MGLGGGFSSLNGDDAVRVSGLQGGSPKTSQAAVAACFCDWVTTSWVTVL